MLALTFTNKAVNEMKYRILKSLYLLAYKIEIEEISGYRSSLILDLSLDKKAIEKKLVMF